MAAGNISHVSISVPHYSKLKNFFGTSLSDKSPNTEAQKKVISNVQKTVNILFPPNNTRFNKTRPTTIIPDALSTLKKVCTADERVLFGHLRNVAEILDLSSKATHKVRAAALRAFIDSNEQKSESSVDGNGGSKARKADTLQLLTLLDFEPTQSSEA